MTRLLWIVVVAGAVTIFAAFIAGYRFGTIGGIAYVEELFPEGHPAEVVSGFAIPRGFSVQPRNAGGEFSVSYPVAITGAADLVAFSGSSTEGVEDPFIATNGMEMAIDEFLEKYIVQLESSLNWKQRGDFVADIQGWRLHSSDELAAYVVAYGQVGKRVMEVHILDHDGQWKRMVLNWQQSGQQALGLL